MTTRIMWMNSLVLMLLAWCKHVSTAIQTCNVTGSIDEYDLKCKPVLTGVTLIIPCGPSTSSCGSDEAFYTYRNESNGQSLKNISSTFLEIETKFYQNGNKIICIKRGCGSGHYSYELNILFPPTGVHDIRKSSGTFNEMFNQTCPVEANPPPHCTWGIYICGSNRNVDISTGITYTNQNCTMSIEHLTDNFSDYCYQCNATNEYNTTIVHYNSIIISYCHVPQPSISFDGNIQNNTSINRTVGENITLVCSVYGIDCTWPFYWYHNGTECDHTMGLIDKDHCRANSSIALTDLNFNNSGVYRCDHQCISQTVYATLNVIPSTSPQSKPNLRKWIGSSAGVFVFLAIVLTSIVIPILFYLIRRKHLKWNNPGDHSYDVFLSFAQEDEEIVEKKIKIPLENKDYRVLWHHFDFIGGVAINENMRDAVNKSRVTITVLSEHFLASDFCKAEMNFALMKGTDTHSKCVIPVLIDDCDVPLELKDYTYISVNEPNFLDKLYRDLGDPLEVERPIIISLRHSSSFGYTTLSIQ